MSSFFDKIETGIVRKPFFICLYAGPGIGKTDFAKSFPDPFFYDFEESTHQIDVKRSRPKTFQEILDDLDEIEARQKITEFKTMAFDTIDEMERLIHWHVASEEKKSNIRKIGWQKGYDYAVDYWAQLVSKCRSIRDKHGINFVFLAHAQHRNITNSDVEATYTKNCMALHPKAADYIFGQVEIVLYAKKEVSVKMVDDKVFAKDLNSRVICTTLNVGWDAKNRIGLPPFLKMPFNKGYSVLQQAYEKAIGETPEKVYKECLELSKKVEDEDERKKIQPYIEKNKDNIAILRMCREKIENKIGDSDEQSAEI